MSDDEPLDDDLDDDLEYDPEDDGLDDLEDGGDGVLTPAVDARLLQPAALTLSGLDLMMTDPHPEHGWRIHALGDEFELGDPEAVIAAIVSQLEDGDVEHVENHENREAVIPLRLDAPGSPVPGNALALAAAALDDACRFTAHTELVYTPPLGGAEASVFEVATAVVSTLVDDLLEIRQGHRYVNLTIRARPFARSRQLVTTTAPAVIGNTIEPIDDGSTASVWQMVTTAPPVLRNLIRNPKPTSAGAVNSVPNWARGSGCSQIQSLALSGVTPPPLRASSDGKGGRCYVDYTEGSQPRGLPVTPGHTYQIGVDLAMANGPGNGGIRARFLDAAGKVLSEQNINGALSQIVFATRGRTTLTAPTRATRLALSPNAALTKGTGNGFWMRQMRCYDTTETGAVPETYFDGDTPADACYTYGWEGTISARTPRPPTLAAAGGRIRGTAFGATAVTIRRTAAIAMAALPFLRVTGQASPGVTSVTLADAGSPVAAASSTLNPASGDFEIFVHRAGGFTSLEVTASGGPKTRPVWVEIDNVELTDNPYGDSAIQTRVVDIYGSQRTELSLSVLGVDGTGTEQVGLGEQVLVYTAPVRGERPRFLACRHASGLVGTPQAGTTSGQYNPLGTTAAGGTRFEFPASALAPGSHMVYARLRSATVGSSVLSLRSVGPGATDPVTGWKTTPITVVAAGAGRVWPQLPAGAWTILPLGVLKIPPADLDDEDRALDPSVGVALARGANAVDVDDVFVCHTDGDVSLLDTLSDPGWPVTSASRIRLDAPTIDHPYPQAWVGVQGEVLFADPSRWVGADHHRAEPGHLLVATVTPGCLTSRISWVYYPRSHTYALAVAQPSQDATYVEPLTPARLLLPALAPPEPEQVQRQVERQLERRLDPGTVDPGTVDPEDSR